MVGFAVELDQFDLAFGVHRAQGVLAKVSIGSVSARRRYFGHEHQVRR